MNGMMIGALLLAAQLNGVWSEKGPMGEMRLALSEQGVGYLENMNVKTCFTWRMKGDGHVTVYRRDGDEFHEMATFAYDAAKDAFDLTGGERRMPEGMSGVLKRAGDGVLPDAKALDDYKKSLKKPDPLASFDRAERLKKLIAEKNPDLKQVTSLVKAIETDRLVKEKVLAVSADADYPRVLPAWGKVKEGFCMYEFYTGCYYADSKAKHLEDPREGWRTRKPKPDDPPCQVGVKPELIKAFCEGMEKLDLHVVKSCLEHGKGSKYWREDSLGVLVTGEKLPAFYELLRQTILSDETTPRWIMDMPL